MEMITEIVTIAFTRRFTAGALKGIVIEDTMTRCDLRAKPSYLDGWTTATYDVYDVRVVAVH